jgi:hypothetical protein
MFVGWDNFFILIGTAAGGLIGLLFVVATLSAGRDLSTVTRGARIYTTPLVFHLSVVLLVSAATQAPGLQPRTLEWGLGACALVGLIYSVVIGFGFRVHQSLDGVHWTDFWFYAVGAGATYIVLGSAAIRVGERSLAAPYWTAFAVLAILFLTIRNAWDLVTWLAPRRGA